MTRPLGWVTAASVAYVAGLVVRAALAYGPASIGSGGDLPVTMAILLPSLLLGWLVAVRAPTSPIGPALAWTGALPAVVFAVEDWGSSYHTAHAWPGARTVEVVAAGVWTWLFLGFAILVLVFPDGLLPGRRWRTIAIAVPVWLALVNFVIATDIDNYSATSEPERVVGRPPFVLPAPVRGGLIVVAMAGLIGILLAVAVSLVVRYRRGRELDRIRLRWLMCAAISVPVLLATSWLAIAAGLPGDVAYLGFLVAMLFLVPAAITVAILRHDLLDIDRFFGTTVSWLITTIVSAAIFAAVVVAVDTLFPRQQRAGVTSAAFVTALLLLPLFHWLHRGVGRLVDPDRTTAVAQIKDFVRRVRDGQAEPEQVQNVLRKALGDPELQVILQRPGEELDLPEGAIPLSTGDSAVGALVLGTTSARRVRRAREAAVEARLPIEVSRLRLELQDALAEVRASRSRLMAAVTVERQRLERDLHDGAQQQLIAVGMRLRSLQHRLGATQYKEIDELVESLEQTVAELRRIAHGVRPSRLDDGLAVALRRLVQDSSVPVDLVVPEVQVGEGVATAVYFTVGEAIANTLKHARATRISIEVEQLGQRLRVVVRDDGIGGAREGFGLTSLRDRVASVGGSLTLDSPPGAGTSIRAEIPCAS
ncbi:sensor histidine kinase [Kribbella voronezhensis]|uniref:sensor histidine kinase n=1 Tax=Kribbella voronezhensis TaxID=2512212 RepID=UPI0010629A9C|nr:histidine kinase [Kribbella voronezhensis]